MKVEEKHMKALLWLAVITLIIVGSNSYRLSQLEGVSTGTSSLGGVSGVRGDLPDIIPTGVPEVYGAELGISYDGVSANNPGLADATITKLGQIDRSVELSGADLERYINVLYVLENGMSCEYCCGARSIIFEDGSAACGCAHSYAMRGLTKYLIKNHGDEFTDEEILSEISKWKVLFFPTQMVTKAGILEQRGIEPNYINVASNKYRGAEKGASTGGGSGSGMVGGC